MKLKENLIRKAWLMSWGVLCLALFCLGVFFGIMLSEQKYGFSEKQKMEYQELEKR